MTSQFVILTLFGLLAATSPPKIDLPEPTPSFCPHDESIPNFDIKKMLGKWYITEESTTMPPENRNLVKAIAGQTFTISEIDDKYNLKHTVGRTNPYEHLYEIVQEDRKIRRATPNLVNELKFAVVATDYDNVALVITCEQNFSASRVARILVKNRNVDKKYIEEMRSKLPEYGFSEENMLVVEL